MPEVVLLDAGPLGLVARPRPAQGILAWLAQLLAAGVEVLVAEIADYEVRRELLKDALLRAHQAADLIGCRAVVVHAMDEGAEAFYQRFGFAPSPADPFRLFLLMKDIKASLGISPGERKS